MLSLILYKNYFIKFFHVVFLFCCILFFNNQVFAVIQDDKLVRIKIYCGETSGGRSGWFDSFFATTTEHTFQGTRYYGHQGGIGYEIFSGFKTKKRLIIKVNNREAGERHSSKYISDGEMSVIEHLSKGLKRTDETKAGKRKCEMKLGDSVPVRTAMAAENIRKNYDLSFEKVKKLEKKIIHLKKQVSLLNTSIENEKKNKRLTEEKIKAQEKKRKLAEEKLQKQGKKRKLADEKIKKQDEDLKITEEKRLLEELKQKIAEEKKN